MNEATSSLTRAATNGVLLYPKLYVIQKHIRHIFQSPNARSGQMRLQGFGLDSWQPFDRVDRPNHRRLAVSEEATFVRFIAVIAC